MSLGLIEPNWEHIMKSYINDPLEIIGFIIALAAVILAGVESLETVDTFMNTPFLASVFGFGAMVYAVGHKGEGEKGLDIDAVKAGGNRLIVEFEDGVQMKDFMSAYSAYQAEATDEDGAGAQ